MRLGISLSPLLVLQAAAALASDDVLLVDGGSCPADRLKVVTNAACKTAREEVQPRKSKYRGKERTSSWPSGCYYCDGVQGCQSGTWLNRHPNGGRVPAGVQTYCAKAAWSGCSNGGCAGGATSVLFAGDSDIELWKKTRQYFPGSANEGVGGWTCRKLRKKIGGFLDRYNPEWVVLVCGENDVGNGRTVSATFDDFRAIVSKINAAGIRVLYVGSKPEPSTSSLHAKYRAYDRLIRQHAASLASAALGSRPPLIMVDSYRGFVDLGNPNSLYAGDRLHLSKKGYAHWTTWTQQALAQASTACEVWRSGACTQNGGRR